MWAKSKRALTTYKPGNISASVGAACGCAWTFETMFSRPGFEADRPLTGMATDCNLVDADYQLGHANRGRAGCHGPAN